MCLITNGNAYVSKYPKCQQKNSEVESRSRRVRGGCLGRARKRVRHSQTKRGITSASKEQSAIDQEKARKQRRSTSEARQRCGQAQGKHVKRAKAIQELELTPRDGATNTDRRNKRLQQRAKQQNGRPSQTKTVPALSHHSQAHLLSALRMCLHMVTPITAQSTQQKHVQC